MAPVVWFVAQQILPVVQPQAEMAPIWAIVILLVLKEVFGFLTSFSKKQADRRSPEMYDAIRSISDNLVKMRENDEKEKELFQELRHDMDTTLENTVALRGMGHRMVNQQQQSILVTEQIRDELNIRRRRLFPDTEGETS